MTSTDKPVVDAVSNMQKTPVLIGVREQTSKSNKSGDLADYGLSTNMVFVHNDEKGSEITASRYEINPLETLTEQLSVSFFSAKVGKTQQDIMIDEYNASLPGYDLNSSDLSSTSSTVDVD